MPGDLLSDTNSEGDDDEEGEYEGFEGDDSDFSSLDPASEHPPQTAYPSSSSQHSFSPRGATAGVPPVFRGAVPTAPSPKSHKVPSPHEEEFQSARGAPSAASASGYSSGNNTARGAVAGATAATGASVEESVPGSSRPGTARPKSAVSSAKTGFAGASAAQEQHSEASMAHLAELYSKQGKDLYSSGSYARYDTSCPLFLMHNDN